MHRSSSGLLLLQLISLCIQGCFLHYLMNMCVLSLWSHIKACANDSEKCLCEIVLLYYFAALLWAVLETCESVSPSASQLWTGLLFHWTQKANIRAFNQKHSYSYASIYSFCFSFILNLRFADVSLLSVHLHISESLWPSCWISENVNRFNKIRELLFSTVLSMIFHKRCLLIVKKEPTDG